MQVQSTAIGETQYEDPDDSNNVIKLFICKPAVIMENDELQKSFGAKGVNLDSLAQVVSNYSQETLKKMVSNSAVVKVKLDGHDLELTHKKHFYLNAKDKEANSVVVEEKVPDAIADEAADFAAGFDVFDDSD